MKKRIKTIKRADIKKEFLSALPRDWQLAAPPKDKKAAVDSWLELLVEEHMTSVPAAWLKRMTRTVASLAMALSSYEKKASSKREIDDASLFLAAILVSYSCHDDGPPQGQAHIRGRVCSNVMIGKVPNGDAVLALFKQRFGQSGLSNPC